MAAVTGSDAGALLLSGWSVLCGERGGSARVFCPVAEGAGEAQAGVELETGSAALDSAFERSLEKGNTLERLRTRMVVVETRPDLLLTRAREFVN